MILIMIRYNIHMLSIQYDIIGLHSIIYRFVIKTILLLPDTINLFIIQLYKYVKMLLYMSINQHISK